MQNVLHEEVQGRSEEFEESTVAKSADFLGHFYQPGTYLRGATYLLRTGAKVICKTKFELFQIVIIFQLLFLRFLNIKKIKS